jgi:hypothetical protein
VVLAAIQQKIEVNPDLRLILQTIKEDLSNQQPLMILDPVDQIWEQTTRLTESMKAGEDFVKLAGTVIRLFTSTARACSYFVHVIEPLWAQKYRGLEVTQARIDEHHTNFN